MGIEAFKDIWKMPCFANSHFIFQIKVNAEDVIKKYYSRGRHEKVEEGGVIVCPLKTYCVFANVSSCPVHMIETGDLTSD